MEQKSIVHILAFEKKFSDGYIAFMRIRFPAYRHIFLCHPGEAGVEELVAQYGEDAHFVPDRDDLSRDPVYLEMYERAEKVVVSGLFAVGRPLAKLNKRILGKCYLQFWGADYHSCGSMPRGASVKGKISWYLNKRAMEKVIARCGAVMNLVGAEWNDFCAVFPRATKNCRHYVAPMPTNPEKQTDFRKYATMEQAPHPLRVVVGNSATPTNGHEEIFAYLSRFRDTGMEVYVPLSYGDPAYKQTVLAWGRDYLGDAFRPMEDFMEKETYFTHLAGCDIGIFNHNRQQAMGNITVMVSFGKKVYLRTDTPMWDRFRQGGAIAVYDVATLADTTYEDFASFPADIAARNIDEAEKMWKDNDPYDAWKQIYEL